MKICTATMADLDALAAVEARCFPAAEAASREDLAARLRTHNAGKGSRYVRARLPARLAYYEVFSQKSAAMRREAALKALSHREKAALAAAFRPQEREVLTP